MILSIDFKEIESFHFDFKIPNQNQMILSCDFKQIESFDSAHRLFLVLRETFFWCFDLKIVFIIIFEDNPNAACMYHFI